MADERITRSEQRARDRALADEAEHAADPDPGSVETVDPEEAPAGLYVLSDGFVARTSEKGKATKRYRRGEKFNPVKGVHDVDHLISLGVVGRKTAKGSLQRATALGLGKRAAAHYQENSPVLDLTTQPFEITKREAEQGSNVTE